MYVKLLIKFERILRRGDLEEAHETGSLVVACGRSCFSRDHRLSSSARPRGGSDTLEEAISRKREHVVQQNRARMRRETRARPRCFRAKAARRYYVPHESIDLTIRTRILYIKKDFASLFLFFIYLFLCLTIFILWYNYIHCWKKCIKFNINRMSQTNFSYKFLS